MGLPICSTRSTGEKSTPRSRLEVATTAFSKPSFSPCSTQRRTFASSDPWCSATTPAQSGRASSRPWYQISACERVFVKTSVEGLASIASTTSSSIASPRCPAHGKRSTSRGMIVSITIFLSLTPLTMRPAAPASSRSRAWADESISERLSGVVIMAEGMRLFCFVRSPVAVSPVRRPSVQGLSLIHI